MYLMSSRNAILIGATAITKNLIYICQWWGSSAGQVLAASFVTI